MTFKKVFSVIQQASIMHLLHTLHCARYAERQGKEEGKKLLLSVLWVTNLMPDFACIFLFCRQGTLMRYTVFLQRIRLRLREVKQQTQGHTARKRWSRGKALAPKTIFFSTASSHPPRTGYESFLIIITIIIVIIALSTLNIVIWNITYIQTSVFIKVHFHNEFSQMISTNRHIPETSIRSRNRI